MMFKLTTAFVAAAALLCATAQADMLQCSKTANKANIIQVDAFSASDFGSQFVRRREDIHSADIVLTQKYHSNVDDAHHFITMRHEGTECKHSFWDVGDACNEDYVQDPTGSSCAQVIHKTHRLGWTSGKAFEVVPTETNSPVHFRVRLAPSLQTWWGGLPNTCAAERFSASEHPMTSISFRADSSHKWTKVVVFLDQAEPAFGESWSCGNSKSLSAIQPKSETLDGGKTWTFYNVGFDPILY